MVRKRDTKMDKELSQAIFNIQLEQFAVEQKKWAIQERLGIENWDEVLILMMKFKMAEKGVLS